MDYAAGEVIVTFKPEYMPTPNEVTAAPPSFGITALDSLIEAVEGQALVKLVPTYGELTTELGQLMERKFLLVYSSEEDPMDIRETLLEQSCFEDVTVNTLWWFDFAGASRVAPGDTTRFPDQWYFDNTDSGDMSDIDMPEAWAIEQGDPDLVIGIFDSGIMVDRCLTTNWRLHSDFNYFFLPDEDHGTTGVLTTADDLNGMDDNNDGFVDNVIGTNLTKGCVSCSDQNPAGFWNSIPSDWILGQPQQCPPRVLCCTPPPETWEVTEFEDHGTRVASIAAGKMDGLKKKHPGSSTDHKDIVGAAPKCKIYSVRFGCPLGDAQAALALRLLATHCRVVNMSFGTPSRSFFDNDSEEFEKMVVAVTKESAFDCVLVASTGNATGQVDPAAGINYPAYFDSVLAVGGISRRESEQSNVPQRVSYSKYSSSELKVDLVAPIEELPAETEGILANRHGSCTTGSCAGFNPVCSPNEEVENSRLGTSFAAPQVSGVATLVRSRFPSLTQFQVKQRLRRSGEFYWSGSRPSYQHGYGKVNAYRALTEWGSITENTTWSATDTRDGAYYITGDLTIETGKTLTIEAGTVVRVAPDHEQTGSDPNRVQIVVKGSLVINGTAEDPVVFESFTDSDPTDSDWIGIQFASGSSGSLSHVVIKNASRAIENRAAITLASCTIIDCEVAIDAHANVTATGTLIADNTDSFTAVDLNAGTASFTQCTFANNAGSALAARGSSAPAMNLCVATFNGGPAVRAVSGWTGSAAVANSVFYSNATASGSFTDAEWVTEGTAVFNENPAFCDSGNHDYTLYAFSPAARGPHFAERAGARPVGCVPDAIVTATALVKGCPAGDADNLVITVDLDETVMTRNVAASEIRLDVAGLLAKVMDDDSLVTAVAPAESPDYETTIEHDEFGYYCIDDPVAVLLNGYPLEAEATVNIRTMDCVLPFGAITVADVAKFSLHYPSPPEPYDPSVDINADGSVTLADFSFLGIHYGHASTNGVANLIHQLAQASATVTFRFTEEYPTATTHRLYVDADVEAFAGVQVAVFSLLPGNERVSFVAWEPATNPIGKILFTPVERDGLPQLFFSIQVSESFSGTSADLGRLVFDVTGNDPLVIGEGEFVLTVGDVLVESPGAAAVAARMAGTGTLGRVLDPLVQRIYHNRLEQNFPNPFNPTTTVAFSMKEPGNVSLLIYDVAGRRVRELVKERRDRGVYRVVWDGRNDAGSPVSTGVYFYNLIAGSFTETRKMTLIK